MSWISPNDNHQILRNFISLTKTTVDKSIDVWSTLSKHNRWIREFLVNVRKAQSPNPWIFCESDKMTLSKSMNFSEVGQTRNRQVRAFLVNLTKVQSVNPLISGKFNKTTMGKSVDISQISQNICEWLTSKQTMSFHSRYSVLKTNFHRRWRLRQTVN
jgi:hypothetical protein